MKNLNVLYLTMNPNRQSTTAPTEEWFRLLPEEGLCPVLVSTEIGDFANWSKSQGIASYQDNLPLPCKTWPFPYLASLRNLKKIGSKHQIDIIHCNEQNVYPIGKSLGRRLRVPVVVSVHFTLNRGFCEWAFTGSKEPDWTFFLTEGSRDACRPGTEGIIKNDKSSILPNGLDLETFGPNQTKREAFRNKHNLRDKIAVGVACALRPRKQIEHLFEAANKLDNPDLNVVLAGGPIHEDREYAKKLVEWGKSLLGDRLIALGHQDDLTGFYNGLDIFLNTSKEEACSISVIESLAQGCPVLGYPSKSVHCQILPHGGEIIEQDDLASLTSALHSWTKNRDALKDRRILARRQAMSRFDSRTLSKQLLETYKRVVGRS